jgi:hypothetical protein
MTSTYGSEPNKQMAIDILKSRGERCQDVALIESDKKKKQAEKVKNLDQHTYVRGRHVDWRTKFEGNVGESLIEVSWNIFRKIAFTA